MSLSVKVLLVSIPGTSPAPKSRFPPPNPKIQTGEQYSSHTTHQVQSEHSNISVITIFIKIRQKKKKHWLDTLKFELCSNILAVPKGICSRIGAPITSKSRCVKGLKANIFQTLTHTLNSILLPKRLFVFKFGTI